MLLRYLIKITLLFVAVTSLTNCMQPKQDQTQYPKTADLEPNFNIVYIGSGFISCNASFFSTQLSTFISLEADAMVSCNGNPMTYNSNAYSTTIPYTPGKANIVTIFRPQSGSSIVSNAFTF
jgi:hypothetical protein